MYNYSIITPTNEGSPRALVETLSDMRVYVIPGAVHPKPAGLLQTLKGIDLYTVPGGVVFFEGRERRCVAGGVFVKRDVPV